ncbi:MAG: DUF134 domain-containing protein [Candidatus Omnitrophica bacterium]|nr:DUF134 domain-containing protein [Candidatus Omnitrophota bacterium]
MRPKKTRWVKCEPGERCFRPQCKSSNQLDGVHMTLDEFEAVRLADYEGLTQEAAAKKLKISRPTFSRIIASAYSKIGDALVNIKAIKIEGGCCKITRRKK